MSGEHLECCLCSLDFGKELEMLIPECSSDQFLAISDCLCVYTDNMVPVGVHPHWFAPSLIIKPYLKTSTLG